MTSSSWNRIVIDCDENKAEYFESVVDRYGAQSISLSFNTPGRSRITAIFDPLWDQGSVVHSALESMKGSDDLFHVQRDVLPDRNWVLESQQNFQPLRVSEKLWITAPWHSIDSTGCVNVVILPGMSFGTGHHQTTQLCLQFLSRLDLRGCTILDYGCGSGILAIAGLALGADFAWGVDIDPDALEESRKNAERNGYADRYHSIQPDEIPTDFCFDVVIANLFSRALIQLSGDFNRYTKAGGWIAVSGILETQVNGLLGAFDTPEKHSVLTSEEWAIIVMERSG